MESLQSIDVAVFRLINGTLSNSFLDAVMPVFAGNAWFAPVLLIAAIAALWKGGARSRVAVLMLAIIIPIGDGWITYSIKEAVGRPRPCLTLENVNLPIARQRGVAPGERITPIDGVTRPIGCSENGSFPSGHTTNWFAGTMVIWMYYRRALRFVLPLACIVGFSRIYNGVHYPSDVLGGAIIGAGYAVALVIAIDGIWQTGARRLFPLWWAALPSLREPILKSAKTAASPAQIEEHWLRAGYVLIGSLFAWRLYYLAAGFIELSEDEAYQWLWSKHPALSYFSKPPLISYTQWLGTHLWGDTEFGVRFFSPVLAAIGSAALLRFFNHYVNARAGFWLIVLINLTPLLALGSTLLTVDPLLVAFWTLAMICGWKAVEPDVNGVSEPSPSGLSTTRWWAIAGLFMGLAFLSKYTALLQWLCWAVFFALCKPARGQLRKPGPYLALLINALCALPVIIWNSQHGWITAAHVANDARLDVAWKYEPGNMLSFLGGAAAVLGPITFIAMVWACIAMWKKAAPLLRYLFSMGAPLFLVYLLYTIHSGVLVNWIAASIIPLLCVTAVWWEQREREGARGIRPALALAVATGLVFTVFLHESSPFLDTADNLRRELKLKPLSYTLNPHRRARGWKEMARIVERERRKLEAEDGKPAFTIGGHYGTTSVLSFYTPDARTNLTTRPLVYYRYMRHANNQFYFWPTYRGVRTGENAVYVQEKDKPAPAPPDVVTSFRSVESLGTFNVIGRGRLLHRVQIFACRDLR